MVTPPGSLTLDQELAAIKARVDELSQRKEVVPVCRVRLSSDVTSLAAGQDIWAQLAWSAYEDPFGMFTLGTTGVFSSITLKHPGAYYVQYHSTCIGATSGIHASKVTLNGTNVTTDSIATDVQTFPTTGGDGAVTDSIRGRVNLGVGDRLYWGDYVSPTGCTLRSINLAVPTEITVLWLSPR